MDLVTLAMITMPLLAAADLPADNLWARAQLALGERDCAVAVKQLEVLIDLDPGRIEARPLIGECLMKLRRPADALKHYKEWAKARPDDPAARDAVAAAERELARARDEHLAYIVATPAPTRPPSLAAMARDIVASARQGQPNDVPAVSSDHYAVVRKNGRLVRVEIAPELTRAEIETMRSRAESVLKPRMKAVADAARELSAGRRLYDRLCTNKQPAAVFGDAPPTTTDEWESRVLARQAQSVDCDTLPASIAAQQKVVDGAFSGVDQELSAVHPDIRAEVRARLEVELW
jgi:hypothetical protein